MNTFLLFVPLVLLVWASVQDIRTKKVDNKLSSALLMSGVVFCLLETKLLVVIVPFLVSFILSFSLWKMKKMGGADMKIIIGLTPYLILGTQSIREGLMLVTGFWIMLMLVAVFYAKVLMTGKNEIPFVPTIVLTYTLSVIGRLWA